MRECKIEACGRETLAKEVCGLHYQRIYRGSSDPTTPRPSGRKPGSAKGMENPNWRGGKSGHPLYLIYNDMVARCRRKTHLRYDDYGGRGIDVCQEWVDDFWQFVEDVGERPEGKTKAGRAYWQLDRIDNDGNYEPGNVRWATPEQQVRNRRSINPDKVIRGSRQKLSKLSEDDVLDIVRRIPEMPRGGQRRLAEEYGVSVSLINNIWRGKIWNWLTNRSS